MYCQMTFFTGKYSRTIHIRFQQHTEVLKYQMVHFYVIKILVTMQSERKCVDESIPATDTYDQGHVTLQTHELNHMKNMS